MLDCYTYSHKLIGCLISLWQSIGGDKERIFWWDGKISGDWAGNHGGKPEFFSLGMNLLKISFLPLIFGVIS
jgi:hypothetical protein